MRPRTIRPPPLASIVMGAVAAASCNASTTVATPDPNDAADVVAVVSTTERATPLIGFNTNAHHSIANWTLGWFRDSTAVLLPAVLRYPGGTTANHWDWQTGWFTADSTTPPMFANITPKGTIRAEEFATGADAAGARPLLVVNVQHSTLAYQLAGLAHAASVGVPVELVELGNEHNLSISNQFMPPVTYAVSSPRGPTRSRRTTRARRLPRSEASRRISRHGTTPSSPTRPRSTRSCSTCTWARGTRTACSMRGAR
ncbi:MAG: hypothetical protein AB7T31_14345 [Gemmatimonadales bacterium]